MRRLDATTDRRLIVEHQRIKPLQKTFLPSLAKKGTHSPSQRPQPMPLPLSRTTRRPSPILQPHGNGRTHRLNGRLKSREISAGPYPHHTMALRTTPAPEQNMGNKTIENNADKSMTPYPGTPTPRTNLGPGPRKIPPLLNNLLDGYTQEDYHVITFWGPQGPYILRAVAPTSHRPDLLNLF